MSDNLKISSLALTLLTRMAEEPGQIEYNTRVLGPSFSDDDVVRLDDAYEELVRVGFAERTGQVISFFGNTKALCKITPVGERFATERRAAS